jgi:hypothetical protein
LSATGLDSSPHHKQPLSAEATLPPQPTANATTVQHGTRGITIMQAGVQPILPSHAQAAVANA